MSTILKKGKTIILLAVLCFLMSGFCAGEAFAATHSIENGHLDRTMLVGETAETDTLFFYSLEDRWDLCNTRVEKDNVNVSSSNPAVVSAEIVSRTEKDIYDRMETRYYFVVTAVSTGTATLSISVPEENVTAEIPMTVFDFTNLPTEVNWPEGGNMNKGDTNELGYSFGVVQNIEESYNDDYWYVDLENCSITSSNQKVIKVTQKKNLNGFYLLEAVGPGTSTVTITVQNFEEEPKLNGLTTSMDITVKEGPKATGTIIRNQLKAKTDVYSDEVAVCFKQKAGDVQYQIYRSTSPTKNFKRIKTITVYEDYKDVDFITNNRISLGKTYGYYRDLSVKPNKKYYYKIRVRYVDGYHNNSWSNLSKAEGYWTTPKWIEEDDVNFNAKTKKLRLPKIKYVKSYIYGVSCIHFEGYNIFGGKVYSSESARRVTSKRVITVKRLSPGSPAEYVEFVRPAAKHGNYYYVHNYRPVKSLKGFKTGTGVDKWASNS